ncbi:MAG: hypothetical protein MK106_08795 [Mariniblastus sp.]|nr:hypothetical protein [Mariniblastus sp.]
MDIDIYQQCPIHTDKKMKFCPCCSKDIVNDLQQILAKNKSKQTKGALDQLDRLIEKKGPRDVLLAIKTHLLIKQGEIESAAKTNDRFLENNPSHFMGKQHQALICLGLGDMPGALDSLQDAMDAIKGNEIPLSFTNVFRMLGGALLQQGHVLAGRAHLQFAQMLKGEPDQELQQMLFESYRLQGGPLLLKTDYRLEQPPEGVEWEKKYLNVMRAMNRGQFRKSLQILEKIEENWPGDLVVARSIAVMTSVMADVENMSVAWRRFAEMEAVAEWQAVEAEALAQMFSTEETSEVIDIVRRTMEVDDVSKVFEIADQNQFLVASQPPEEDPFGEGPAPRHTFVVLDRDQLPNADSLTLENVPAVCGELLVYGKQTDKPGRMVLIGPETDRFATSCERIMGAFSDVVQNDGEREAITSTSRAAESLSWNWHFPEGTTREQHAEIVRQKRSHQLLGAWSEVPFRVLGGQTPREAAKETEWIVPLKALVLQLEQVANSQQSGDDHIVALRQELGIEEPEKIEGVRLETEFISPVRQRHLDFESLSDEQLVGLQSDAMTIGNFAVLVQAIPEILNRESLHEKVPPQSCYSMLARLTEDDTEALDYLSKARHAAREANEPIGTYMVQEFEFRLSRGLTENLPELLQNIQQKHMREPNVEYQMAYVLEKFGLISPEGQSRFAGERAPAVAGDSGRDDTGTSGGAIWTPDEASTSSDSEAASPDEGSSKLWLPDS